MSGGGRKLGSSNFLNQQRLAEACVANEVIARISLRWKMSVLYSIDTGARSGDQTGLFRINPLKMCNVPGTCSWRSPAT
ncbi:MAG TPA: hypothetical protein VLL30_25270, partial [Reyranella sp.]|nr:hypothetical protein [Reyranella sp.]